MVRRSTQPTGIILFASEQIWPNIASLEHARRRRGFQNVHIIHTDNSLKSKAPAVRLQKFCLNRYQQVAELHEIKPDPQTIHDLLLQIIDRLPGNRWIINATGGLKLMLVGVLSLPPSDAIDIIYRELSGDWFILKGKSTGGFSADPFAVEPGELDELSILDLITLQNTSTVDTRWELQKPTGLPILKITQCVIDNRWNWSAAFEALGLPRKSLQNGFLFEEYIAAALQMMGANVALNAELSQNIQNREVPRYLQEVDILVNRKGRLWILDLKLVDAQDERSRKPSQQIMSAAEMRRALGGANAECVLVRPGFEFSAEHRQLAQDHQIKILDGRDCFLLFQTLSDWLDLSLAEDLLKVQKLLQEAYQNFGSVFLKPRRRKSVESLQEAGRSLMRERKRRGIIWEVLPDEYLLQCKNTPDGPSVSALRDCIEEHLSAVLEIEPFFSSPGSRQLHSVRLKARLQISPPDIKHAMDRFLKDERLR